MEERLTPPVLFEERAAPRGKRVGIATLNAEKSLNALSAEMIALLAERLPVWRDDPAIACIVLQGAGGKAFSAGGDIRRLYESMRSCGGGENPYAEKFFADEYRLDYLIHTFPKPVLAWVHGIALGGGLGLMAGASHRVVTERCRLAMPEISIGLYPDVGATWFLNRMPGRSGLYLGLTGASLNAHDALFTKLADFFILEERKSALFAELPAAPWEDDARANRVLLSRLLRAHAARSRDALPASNVRRHFDLIERVTDCDGVSEIAARLAVEPAEDPWIANGGAALASGAPTSAHIVYELYRRAPRLSLKEALMLEWNVSLQCVAHGDLREGIRALIIDKDNRPRWTPATLAEVDRTRVARHLAPPHGQRANPLADL